METRNKKYNKIVDKLHKETKINNKTIKELESMLSKFNSRTCNLNNFVKYVKNKNKLNNILFDNYKKELYRKLKWNRFINTQK